MKKQLVAQIAQKLKSFGYAVYVAKGGRYGFYTDGVRVVSFGGNWEFAVDFSGNYKSKKCGTGWRISDELTDIDSVAAAKFIAENPPRWATDGEAVTLTTPEQHLKTYGDSSGYVQV